MLRALDFRTSITYGWGAFKELRGFVPDGDCLLVLGRDRERNDSFERAVKASIRGRLEKFKGVEPNPVSSTVEEGARKLREFGPDFVLAVGGGSVLDSAKFMAVIAAHGGRPVDYVTKRRVPPDSGFPVYAVPTTPGTSSEITPFAIVTIPELKNKLGLRNPAIYPKAALIDPSLSVSLPKAQTASTGLDILSHAVESYWSKGANPVSRTLCLDAVRLIRKHLEGAYKDGFDRKHREGVSIAGIFAGMSFSNTGTTLCHAISYPVTLDTGLPHGAACALSLGAVFDLLAGRGEEGMDELAEAFGSKTGTFREDLKDFVGRLGCPRTLREAGFSGGPERIMGTDIKGFQENFRVPLDNEEVRGLIKSIE